MVNRVRIFLADSQYLFRQGLRGCLQAVPEVDICGEAAVSTEIVSLIENAVPQVVLLGIRTDADLEFARTIKQRLPSCAVVVITDHADDGELFQAIKSRAAAYVDRQVAPDKLVETIRRAAIGEHPINDALLSRPRVAERVLEQFQDMSWGRGVEAYISPLTPRETQILKLMGQGLLNKQIAAELCLSEQTIKNHVTSILRKLDANARTQAVINGIKRGLINLGDVKVPVSSS